MRVSVNEIIRIEPDWNVKKYIQKAFNEKD